MVYEDFFSNAFTRNWRVRWGTRKKTKGATGWAAWLFVFLFYFLTHSSILYIVGFVMEGHCFLASPTMAGKGLQSYHTISCLTTHLRTYYLQHTHQRKS